MAIIHVNKSHIYLVIQSLSYYLKTDKMLNLVNAL
jgi:hypothetical protein